MSSIHGAYTALITPFVAADGTVDVDRLREQVAFQSHTGMTGVVPCGTTGESPTLSGDEHRMVIERTVEFAVPADLQVIAGAGSNCTREAVAMHRFAAGAGATAALHVCPYYNKPSQAGLERHFLTIADAADLPIVLYDIPGRTGVGLAFETIERLAAHPNIVAIKDATGTLNHAVRLAADDTLTVLSGDDPMTLAMMAVGGAGVISVLGNVLPRDVAALCRAAAEGDIETAGAIHREVLPLANALLHLDGNPVPLKAAMQRLGRDSGALRLPLTPLPEAAARTLDPLLGRCSAPQPA